MQISSQIAGKTEISSMIREKKQRNLSRDRGKKKGEFCQKIAWKKKKETHTKKKQFHQSFVVKIRNFVNGLQKNANSFKG